MGTIKKVWAYPQPSKSPENGQGYLEKTQDANKHSFTKGLRPVVFIGKCFGLIATSNIFQKPENTSKKLSSIARLYSGILAVFFLVHAIFFIRYTLIGSPTSKSSSTSSKIADKLTGITMPSYSLTVFIVYTYLSFSSKKLRNIIQSFVASNSKVSPKFPRFCWLISGVALALGIGENIMYDFQLVKMGSTSHSFFLENYYKQVFYHWAAIIPYNPVLTVVLIILVKCGTWGWVYADVIAMVLARSVTERFRLLNEHIMEKISSAITSNESVNRWDDVRDEYLVLLFFWISPSSSISLEQSFYVDFAFFQFLFRVMSVTYFAADVHHVSYSILDTIQHCPNSLYSLSLERMEKTLIRSPVGISLFSTITITRAFFISIVSFLFTTQIVLLQTAGASSAATPS
ncbi:unnamed protein product [Orchesella dallaii]|uniref:Gustatory receptor n=1 Tax=Orchesella dallaii TaxID=48710 RepID=A0ABP1QCD1_9HEXA